MNDLSRLLHECYIASIFPITIYKIIISVNTDSVPYNLLNHFFIWGHLVVCNLLIYNIVVASFFLLLNFTLETKELKFYKME